MSGRDDAIARIREAFAGNEYPGDAFLVGSSEGCEPAEEVGPFREHTDWRTVEAEMMDGHASALSFFSEAGFRFFLPAFLIADLEERLQTADPLFHLTGGFTDGSVEIPTRKGPFVRRFGGSTFVNPRRYGATTFTDYARYRLSIFTREEAAAIVAYLEAKREADDSGLDAPRIDAALDAFWRERARSAPTAEELARHLEQERAYLAAIMPEEV